MFKRSGDREEQHEEKQSPPVNFGFNVVPGAVGTHDHHHTGTDQRCNDQYAVVGQIEKGFRLVMRSNGADGADNQKKSGLVGNFDDGSQSQGALRSPV